MPFFVAACCKKVKPFMKFSRLQFVCNRLFPVENKMVGAAGFEPATPCSQGRCATKLRYAPTYCLLTALLM